MGSEYRRQDRPARQDTQTLAVEAAFREALPAESVAVAMGMWRRQRQTGERVSLRPLAERVAARLNSEELVHPLYVALLRHSFRPSRRASGTAGSSPKPPAGAADAVGPSTGSASPEPLRQLVNAFVAGLARRHNEMAAAALLEQALGEEFPDGPAGAQYRSWLTGGALPESPPDEPTGRSLVNRLWVGACQALGAEEADRTLAESVRAAESPEDDPELGPRRYL